MEANTRNLERIFDQTIAYLIPLFQRPYVWNEENNWRPLWEDIQALLDKSLTQGSTHSHFLGAIVLEQVSNATGSIEARQVIDGQQRLTTLQLFLVAARDVCRAQGVDKYLERFTDLTSNKASRIDTKEEAYKVWPTNCDREDFAKTHNAGSRVALLKIYSKYPFKTRVDRNIPDAYLFFSEQLEGWLSGQLAEDDETSFSLENRLEALWQVVRAHLQLVVIDLEKEDESQVIFETLNARGTQLLPGDLIKNYLFHKAEKAGEDIEPLYETYWRDFDDADGKFWREEVKQGRLLRPRIDLFLQHYLTLHTQDEVRVAHIFNTFKHFAEHYKPRGSAPRPLPETPGEHLKALSEYGQVFRQFSQTNSAGRLSTFLRRLEAVDTATVYPFLLQVCFTLGKDNVGELNQILVCLESFLVRRMICGLTGKNYNRLFIDLIKAMKSDDAYNVETVASFLLRSRGDSVRFPSDDEFRTAWLESPAYQRLAQYKIRMILGALDAQLEHSKSEALGLPDNLTIEHILPVKWQDHWPLSDDTANDPAARLQAKDQRNRLLHTMGNLTLITGSLNPSLSNAGWQAKKPELTKYSKLNLNRYFHDCDEWSEDAIARRGAVLLDLALQIWPYPITN